MIRSVAISFVLSLLAIHPVNALQFTPSSVRLAPSSGGFAQPVVEFAPSAAGASPAPRGSARWSWPIGDLRTVSQRFDAPTDRYSAGHRGIDIRATPADAVRAPAAGHIVFAGVVVDRPVVTLEHRDHGEWSRLRSSYEPVELNAHLGVGSELAAGDVIGAVSSGGHCGESCVHLGVRGNEDYLDPLLFLRPRVRPVLLPLGGARRG